MCVCLWEQGNETREGLHVELRVFGECVMCAAGLGTCVRACSSSGLFGLLLRSPYFATASFSPISLHPPAAAAASRVRHVYRMCRVLPRSLRLLPLHHQRLRLVRLRQDCQLLLRRLDRRHYYWWGGMGGARSLAAAVGGSGSFGPPAEAAAAACCE